jgi:Icc-related predicted phosphoesterase
MSGNNGKLRVAGLGDIHVSEGSNQRFRDVFAEISDNADVLALCGDLTNLGKPKEAEILAEDLRSCRIPVVAVLGNHDLECGCKEEVTKILQEAGIKFLETQVYEIQGVGFAGVKGFAGGFDRGTLGAFGEDIIKKFVDEGVQEALRLENALRALRTERTVVVLHYAPIVDTVEGEPREIFPFLGTSRLADAIDHFSNISVVFHGHAHRGAYAGKTAKGVPVYNVAQHVVKTVLDKDYAVIEV